MGNFSGRVSTSLTFRVPTTRPKVFNATLPHLSVARNHSRRLSREQNAPSRSRERLGRPFREQNTPFRSRDNLGRPSREQNAPSRSRDILGRPFREQNAPSRSRDNLGRPSREQNAAFRSRDNLGRHRQAFPVPILSPGHFGTPDKPLLYQSYLLATLVHQTSPSCTKNSHTVSLGLLIFLEAVLNCLFEG